MRRCCLWRIDMGCELPSFAGWNGRKSIIMAQPCMWRRAKNGKPATHPIRETKRAHCASFSVKLLSHHLCLLMSEGHRSLPNGFNWLVKRAGQKTGLPFQVHAHMLRHSAGYKLAGDGHDTRAIQDYLGHRNISNTVRYTELSPTRFKDFGGINGSPTRWASGNGATARDRSARLVKPSDDYTSPRRPGCGGQSVQPSLM